MENASQLLNIQTQLEEYQKIVHALGKEEMNDYSVIILKGGLVCESMLSYILQAKGYSVERGMVESKESNRQRGHMGSPLMFCCGPEAKGILPDECRGFLNLIRRYRNEAAHIGNTSFEMVIEFSKALDFFTIWFRDQYINPSEFNADEKAKLCARFFSLQNLLSYPEVCDPLLASSGTAKNNSESILLAKIAEQTELIVKLTMQVSRIDERSERIEKTVNDINTQIKELANQISAYQSLVERQLAIADSDEEIDRIIQAYTEECTERIVLNTKKNTEARIFETEKRKLIISMGQAAWDKLDEASKTFLVSAKVMYNHLIMLDDAIDYSGVCVLVTKALEVEMDKRFYSIFLNYLDRKYRKNYSVYPTALLYQNGRPLSAEKFTMGSLAFVLCYSENRYDTDTQKRNNKQKLIEYAKEKLFSKMTNGQIEKLLLEYAEDIETVRNRYRNPSAHTNELKRIDAEQCFNLVLDVEKLLKKMMDSFDL